MAKSNRRSSQEKWENQGMCRLPEVECGHYIMISDVFETQVIDVRWLFGQFLVCLVKGI